MVCIKDDQTASGTKDAVSLRQHGSSVRNVAWEEVGCERWRVSEMEGGRALSRVCIMTTSNCSSEYGSVSDGLIKSQSIRDAFDTRSFAAAKCS